MNRQQAQAEYRQDFRQPSQVSRRIREELREADLLPSSYREFNAESASIFRDQDDPHSLLHLTTSEAKRILSSAYSESVSQLSRLFTQTADELTIAIQRLSSVCPPDQFCPRLRTVSLNLAKEVGASMERISSLVRKELLIELVEAVTAPLKKEPSREQVNQNKKPVQEDELSFANHEREEEEEINYSAKFPWQKKDLRSPIKQFEVETAKFSESRLSPKKHESRQPTALSPSRSEEVESPNRYKVNFPVPPSSRSGKQGMRSSGSTAKWELLGSAARFKGFLQLK